jgi:drug/metabolite transporter (DMT)-like permease
LIAQLLLFDITIVDVLASEGSQNGALIIAYFDLGKGDGGQTKPNFMPSSFLLHLALFAVALIYGINYNVAKFFTPQFMNPIAVILVRVCGATLLFILYFLFAQREKIQHKKDWFALIYCAAFGVAINQMLFFKGLSITSAVNASVMMILTPVIVFLISVLLKKEKLSIYSVLGLLLGASGAMLLMLGKDFNFSRETIEGDIMILLNAFSYGLYLVLVKPLMTRYNALTITFWIFVLGIPMVLPFALPSFITTDFTQFTASAWFAIAYIVVFTTFLAYFLNSWTLRFVNSSLVGYYIYLQPVFAILIAVFWSGESISKYPCTNKHY